MGVQLRVKGALYARTGRANAEKFSRIQKVDIMAMNSVDDSIGKVVRKQCTENAKERCADETAASATDLSIRWAERFTADRASAPFKNQQIDSLQKKTPRQPGLARSVIRKD